MKRQYFLLLACILLFLPAGAKEAEETSSVYDGDPSFSYSTCAAYIVKIDDGLGKDSFYSFEVDLGRGRGPSIHSRKQCRTLEQALSELDVILLRQMRRYSQNSVYLNKDSLLLNFTNKARLKEFTAEERLKIDNFLKGKVLAPVSCSDESSADQKETMSAPVKVSTASGGSDSDEITFDWEWTPFMEKEIPDFAISEEDVLKPFYDIGFSNAPREKLAQIIGKYDVLKDGKTMTGEVKGEKEARFFVTQGGNHYLLGMMKVLSNKGSYVFVLDSLDSASINEKGEIVRSHKEKGHVRIFEHEPLYHDLEQFLETHQSRRKEEKLASFIINLTDDPTGYWRDVLEGRISFHSFPDTTGVQSTKPVPIVTKFIQVGGGTEESSFDWVEPRPLWRVMLEHYYDRLSGKKARVQ